MSKNDFRVNINKLREKRPAGGGAAETITTHLAAAVAARASAS